MKARIEHHGSIVLVRALDDEGAKTLTEMMSDDTQYWCGAVVVEPRYIADLTSAMREVFGFSFDDN